MSTQELHKAQTSILRTLRHVPSARYTLLRRPTGMESDVFKFHLRKLIHAGFVYKDSFGRYQLTPSGKEFANNLSKTEPSILKQPKLSIAIIARRDVDGVTQYLCQRRLRHPFYDFWGCLSGPVQWGESFEAAAQREFEKQTGLRAHYAVRAFYRKTDYAAETDDLFEDKLLVVIEATDLSGMLTNEWHKGFNAWMTLDELASQEKYFESTCTFIEMVQCNVAYSAQNARYLQTEY